MNYAPIVIVLLSTIITIANIALIKRDNRRRRQWRSEMDELHTRRQNIQQPNTAVTHEHQLTQAEADHIRAEWARTHGKPA